MFPGHDGSLLAVLAKGEIIVPIGVTQKWTSDREPLPVKSDHGDDSGKNPVDQVAVNVSQPAVKAVVPPGELGVLNA